MSDKPLGTGPEIEYESWLRQTRRGALSLAALTIILNGESYGYDIMKQMSSEEYSYLQVEPSTIYPLLRRLDERGILEGRWVEVDNKKRKLYYITREGKIMLRQMVKSWRLLHGQLMKLVEEAGME